MVSVLIEIREGKAVRDASCRLVAHMSYDHQNVYVLCYLVGVNPETVAAIR